MSQANQIQQQQLMQQQQMEDNNGLDQSLVSASFQQYPPQMMSATSIEQQLDLKYKAYSTMNHINGGGPQSSAMKTAQQNQPGAGGVPPQGQMLPQHSQFLYNNQLRTSMEMPKGHDAINMQDLQTAGQLSQQQQHQFLNMNASMGSQQNQNLGPTQIFYQGVPPSQPTNNVASSNALPTSQGAFAGAPSTGQPALGQNNMQALAQLLQLQNGQTNPSQGQQPVAGSNQTQLLLLELLRQNNMQQQPPQHPQQQMLDASSAQNPSNQSLFGQGFLGATQLLAQTSQQNQETATPQMTASKPPQQLQQNLPQPEQLLTSQIQQQQPTGTASGAPGYSQNLNQIYQNLNNYQSMIENLENNGLNSGSSNKPSNSNDALNHSRFQSNTTTRETPVPTDLGVVAQPVTQQHHHAAAMSVSATPQPQQQSILAGLNNNNSNYLPQQQQHQMPQQQQELGRSISPSRSSAYQRRPVAQQEMGAGLGASQFVDFEQPPQARMRDRDTYDHQYGRDEFDRGDRDDRVQRERALDRDALNDSQDAGRDDDVDIMWPSSVQRQPRPERQEPQMQHNKSTSGEGRQNFHQEQSVSGVDWVSKQNKGQNNNRNTGSMEEEDDSHHSGMRTDFNYKEENSNSGFDRDIRRQNSREEQQPQQNRWMRQSTNEIDIDELPIPTAGEGPKTFEELLEEKMQAAEALASASKTHTFDNVPKKQFLKRKKPAYVPPSKPATKHYKYYSDAIQKKEGQPNEEQQNDSATRNSRRATGGQQSDERRRTQTPNSGVQNSSRRQENFNNDLAVSSGAAALDSGPPRQRNVSVPPQAASTQPTPTANPAQNSRPFLKRGTGTAHLRGRLGSNNAASSNNLHNKNEQQKPTTPKVDKNQKLNNGLFHKQTSQVQQSIDDFQRLEQECHGNDMGQQQMMQQPPSRQPQQSRKKKLFDDSDSDREEPQDGAGFNNGNDMYGQQNMDQHRDQSPGQSRSNLVKKMFYKDEGNNNKQQQKAQKPQQQNNAAEDDESKPYMSGKMEALLAKKQDQLEKAIQRYNADNEQLAQKKSQYDNLLRKVKADQREVENQKKRTNEDVEKMKEEEMSKVRKEKKALEQRQKNFQLVSSTAKKEREEIDQLRREYNKYRADAELKAKKQQSQIERLTKQNNEFKQKNKELQEDLRAMEQQRIILEKAGPSGPQTQNRSNNPGSKLQASGSQYGQQQQTQQSRYSFNQQQSQPRKTKEEQLKDQMLFHDPDEQQQPDELAEDEYGNEEQAHQSRLQQPSRINRQQQQQQQQQQYAEDEDEEDLHEEEADQVYDDFGSGLYNNGVNNNGNGEGQHMMEQQILDAEDENKIEADQQNHHQQQKLQSTAGAALSDEEEDFSLKFPKDYHSKSLPNQKVVEQYVGHDGKIQRIYQNGKKEVIFNNGVKRESFPDGYTIVYFNNQDIKQTFPDGKVVYFFAEAQTTQSTFPDKLQVFKFSNNQIEKHFPDKTKEIIFPDGTIKCIFEDGEEESIFPDGTIQKIEKTGIKAIEFANGQKDILYPDGIRVREFPDGKVRKTYPDGRTEVYQR